MRLLFTISFMMILSIPTNGMKQTSVNQPDTGKFLLELNMRMVPRAMKYVNRYNILSTVNSDYALIEQNYSLQRTLSATTYTDSSLLSSYDFLNEKKAEFLVNDIPHKSVFYGIWRDQLTKSGNENDIVNSMAEGTRGLIDLGYSDFKNDFLPFITMLMEENHLVTYDFDRTKGVGSGSKGIVPSTVLLNAVRSMDPSVKAGVCRDIHETGRELLKTMSEVYYDHFYPGSDIDFDEFIFLQSWTTDASQHVTLSLIDPFDRSKVYELDWGRVIEETGIPGYNNGRLYGNTFRIWQYDKTRHRTVPVDFRRTQFGRIIDFGVLTSDEYLRFNGVDDEKSYSDISIKINADNIGAFSLSAGTYHPFQKYLLTGWKLNTNEKKIGNILSHRFTIALQGAMGEDTRKKQYLYPEKDWQFTSSLMGIPRIISKFRSQAINFGQYLSFDAFLYQQLDVFLILNSFTDRVNGHDFSKSGDANLSFSNGINIKYNRARLAGLFSLQARSCLLPDDVRLLTPNPAGLFPHVRFITPAIDAITSVSFTPEKSLSLIMNSVFEYSSLNSLLYSGTICGNKTFQKDISVSVTAGTSGIMSGSYYYWYPPSRSWLDIQLSFNENSIVFDISGYAKSNPSAGVSFIRHFN